MSECMSDTRSFEVLTAGRAVQWARSVATFCVASQGRALGVMVPLAAAASEPVKFARFEAARSDMVELVIGDVVVRTGGDVEPDRLPM